MGKQRKQWLTLFFWAPKSLQMVTAAMKLKDACSLEESHDQPRQHIKKQGHYCTNKCPSSQSYGFSSSHVWLWELGYKESWMLKNWCFWTVVLEIQPAHSKGDQSWVFTERSDVEAETPILWPPDSIEYTRLVYSIEHTNELEELTHSKRLWCWEILKVGGKGDDGGWDGRMASPT